MMWDKMLEFMASQELCVIATASTSAKPEAAIVGFSHTANFELIIGTSDKSRKWANILQNHAVAVVIGNKSAEVQYEGVAQLLPVDEYTALVEDGHFKKLPGAAKFREDPSQVFVKVTPTWARFIMHGEADSMEEFTDFAEQDMVKVAS